MGFSVRFLFSWRRRHNPADNWGEIVVPRDGCGRQRHGCRAWLPLPLHARPTWPILVSAASSSQCELPEILQESTESKEPHGEPRNFGGERCELRYGSWEAAEMAKDVWGWCWCWWCERQCDFLMDQGVGRVRSSVRVRIWPLTCRIPIRYGCSCDAGAYYSSDSLEVIAWDDCVLINKQKSTLHALITNFTSGSIHVIRLLMR